MISNQHIRQFITFSLIGALNTALDFLLYTLFTRWLLIHELIALVLSFIFANMQSYVLNSRFTFSDTKTADHVKRFTSFFLISVLSLGVNVAAFSVLHYQFGINDLVSKLLATGCVVLVSFTLQKFITFNTRLIS